MTVSSQTSTATFVGNGVATAFPLPFRFFDNGDIRAYFIDSVTGAATQMVLGADYTLIGAGEPEVDGNALSLLTTTAPLASMRGLYVERVMQQVQGTDIVNQGQFFASTHEDVFDRLTMLIQQANANSAGAIRVAIGDPEPSRLPSAVQRANLLMGFDSAGDPIATLPATDSATDLAMRLANNIDPMKGAALVGYKGRTAADRLGDVVSVKDFGAVGDGIADDTAAFIAAVAAIDVYGSIYIPRGTYKITSSIICDEKYVSFFGDGAGASIILYSAAVAGVAFDLRNVPATDKSFSFRFLSIITAKVSAGTAIKITGKVTAAPNQVNGENNSLEIDSVRISQTGTGYWTTFLHSIHNGGIIANALTLDNTVLAAQSDTAVRGIILENTDTRVSTIRSIYLSNFYILRTSIGIDFVGNTTTLMESVYLVTGEIVGAGVAGFRVNGYAGAFGVINTHFDCNNYIIDSRAGAMFIGHFVGCDFRKNQSGGLPMVPGPMIAAGGGEFISIVGCQFSGYNQKVSNVLNTAFSFTGALNGISWLRSSITGCTFRNLYYVYGDSSTCKINTTGNTYNVIEGQVLKANSLDSRISVRDATVTKTVVFSLDSTGMQTVGVSVPSNILSGAWPCAIMQVARPTGSDNLTIQYDFDSSTSALCNFIVKGNTTARNVRFSFLATGVNELVVIS